MHGRCGNWHDIERLPEFLAAMGWRGRGGGWGRHGPDWEWDWDRGGRGRGRRRMFDSGELRLVLLKLIAEQPRHGYDLMRAIEELTGGSYSPSPGVVYPTLTMLQDLGYIAESESGGSRKAFSITPEGSSHLEEKAQEVEELFERMNALGERQRRTGSAPVGRAVSNLLSALWHRVAHGDLDEETLHEISAVLDEAAQKIERLK